MWFEKFFSSHPELIFEKIGPHLKINGALRRYWELDLHITMRTATKDFVIKTSCKKWRKREHEAVKS